MRIKNLFVATLMLTLYGCGGGSDGGSAAESNTVLGLSSPASADLITDNSSMVSSLASNIASGYASSYSDIGTDYTNAEARSQVYIGQAGRPMEGVNAILCILNKTSQSTIVNGNYLAVLDLSLCNNSDSYEPSMAKMTIDTSRTNNTSNQVSKLLYEFQSHVVRVDAVVEKEPTRTEPYGQLSLNWAGISPSSTDIDIGSIRVANAENKVKIEFVAELDRRSISDYNSPSTPYHDGNALRYIDAHTSLDGSSGMAKVSYVDRTDSSKKLTYLLNWNSGFIAQYDYDTNDVILQTTCKSRTSYLNSVTNYELFTTSGSKVDLTTHIYGNYLDASNNKKNIYVSKRNAWFEGGETGSNRPSSITTSDGTMLSVSYDAGDSNNHDSDNDGVFATLTGITLSDPIRFTNAVISGSNIVYNDGTVEGTNYTPNYMGSDGKYFWGIPWATISDAYVSTLNIKNGTQLTDMNGNNYILKQSLIRKVPVSAVLSNCATLTAAAVTAETNISTKTSADITAIDSSWVTPVVDDSPKVIDGVVQY